MSDRLAEIISDHERRLYMAPEMMDEGLRAVMPRWGWETTYLLTRLEAAERVIGQARALANLDGWTNLDGHVFEEALHRWEATK